MAEAKTLIEARFRERFVNPDDSVADKLVTAMVLIAAGRDKLAEFLPGDAETYVASGEPGAERVYWAADDAVELARAEVVRRWEERGQIVGMTP
jgi:hypothetical protein